MNKTIGILNLQHVDNYGCVLGAYALEQKIERLGNTDVELINYVPENKRIPLLKRLNIYAKIYGIKEALKIYLKSFWMVHVKCGRQQQYSHESEERKKRFESFRAEYLKRSIQYKKLTYENSPNYDIYLVGSDVVWMADNLIEQNSPYTLAFTEGKTCRRVSYAASLGNALGKRGKKKFFQSIYQNILERFDMVSVREIASLKYLSSFSSSKIWCCVDPVLLLQASDYEILMDSRNKIEEYIYVYMLDETYSLYKEINKISIETRLPIVRCCKQTKGYKNVLLQAEDDGPSEFLSRIKNASLVITNSFHGICFSIVFHKRFYYVKRVQQAFKTEELLKRLGLENRQLDIALSSGILWENIDYRKLDEKLRIWREESEEYLKKATLGQ